MVLKDSGATPKKDCTNIMESTRLTVYHTSRKWNSDSTTETKTYKNYYSKYA